MHRVYRDMSGVRCDLTRTEYNSREMSELQFSRESFRREVRAYHGFTGCSCVGLSWYLPGRFTSEREFVSLNSRRSDSFRVSHLGVCDVRFAGESGLSP